MSNFRARKWARMSGIAKTLINNPEIFFGQTTTTPLFETKEPVLLGSKISLTQTFPISVENKKPEGRVIKVSAEQMAAVKNRQTGGSRSRYKKF